MPITSSSLHRVVPYPVDADLIQPRNARLTRAAQGRGSSARSLTEPRRGGILAWRHSLDSTEIYDKAFLLGLAGEVIR